MQAVCRLLGPVQATKLCTCQTQRSRCFELAKTYHLQCWAPWRYSRAPFAQGTLPATWSAMQNITRLSLAGTVINGERLLD